MHALLEQIIKILPKNCENITIKEGITMLTLLIRYINKIKAMLKQLHALSRFMSDGNIYSIIQYPISFDNGRYNESRKFVGHRKGID